MSTSIERSTSAMNSTGRSVSAPFASIQHNLQTHPQPSSSPPKSASHTFTENDFGFQTKTSFNANKELQKYRSKNFEVFFPHVDNDIWKRSAPDFRPQEYAPRPPKRNTRMAMQPWKYGTYPGQDSSAGPKEKRKTPTFLHRE